MRCRAQSFVSSREQVLQAHRPKARRFRRRPAVGLVPRNYLRGPFSELSGALIRCSVLGRISDTEIRGETAPTTVRACPNIPLIGPGQISKEHVLKAGDSGGEPQPLS